jgi:hypothetical protein
MRLPFCVRWWYCLTLLGELGVALSALISTSVFHGFSRQVQRDAEGKQAADDLYKLTRLETVAGLNNAGQCEQHPEDKPQVVSPCLEVVQAAVAGCEVRCCGSVLRGLPEGLLRGPSHQEQRDAEGKQAR